VPSFLSKPARLFYRAGFGPGPKSGLRAGLTGLVLFGHLYSHPMSVPGTPSIVGPRSTLRCRYIVVDTFLRRQSPNTNQRRCSLRRGGRSVARGQTVRGLVRGLIFLPDGRTVRALGSDGPRVRRGGGRSPAAPESRSREGPCWGGEILGVV
jgi:hypothetical protein